MWAVWKISVWTCDLSHCIHSSFWVLLYDREGEGRISCSYHPIRGFHRCFLRRPFCTQKKNRRKDENNATRSPNQLTLTVEWCHFYLRKFQTLSAARSLNFTVANMTTRKYLERKDSILQLNRKTLESNLFRFQFLIQLRSMKPRKEAIPPITSVFENFPPLLDRSVDNYQRY